MWRDHGSGSCILVALSPAAQNTLSWAKYPWSSVWLFLVHQVSSQLHRCELTKGPHPQTAPSLLQYRVHMVLTVLLFFFFNTLSKGIMGRNILKGRFSSLWLEKGNGNLTQRICHSFHKYSPQNPTSQTRRVTRFQDSTLYTFPSLHFALLC